MNRFLFLLLLIIGALSTLHAQTESKLAYPDVGKACPDFVLHNIKYYSKKKATLKDFSGKWLVLDFWNKNCGACVASFPNTNALQKEFHDKVQFILVGIEDIEQQIEPMFDKFRKSQKLDIPCAFDSTLANRWDIYTAPYIVLIDPDGIVQTLTYSINSVDMQAFLDGKPPKLPRVYRVHEKEIDNRMPFNAKRPFLVNGNGGDDSAFLFRSMLTEFNVYEQHPWLPEMITSDSMNGKFQVLGAPLYRLYNYAYFGTLYPDSGYRNEPVLEIKDSVKFQYSSKYNKNLFCYSLILPLARADKAHMQAILRRDLESCFGFNATKEERKFPCWKLVATASAKQRLKTKGGSELYQTIIPKGDFSARNWPFSEFLRVLRVFTKYEIIDETGITGNIDIVMNCLLTDVEDVKRALQVNGLDLLPAEKEKKVLIIRDDF